jgi:hypothetical protein
LAALVISPPAMICQVRGAGEMLAEDSEVCGSFWPWVHGVGYANIRKHVGHVNRPVCKVSWARVQDISILLRPGSPLLRFLCACSFGVESVDGVPIRLSIAEELRPKYPQHH